MKIYVVIQETQNQHGYVDTCVLEAFTEERLANSAISGYEDGALEDGEAVEGREEEWGETANGANDGDWTVCFKVTTAELYRAAKTSAESQVFIDTGELPVVKDVS
jgi:hypothetical protein